MRLGRRGPRSFQVPPIPGREQLRVLGWYVVFQHLKNLGWLAKFVNHRFETWGWLCLLCIHHVTVTVITDFIFTIAIIGLISFFIYKTGLGKG